MLRECVETCVYLFVGRNELKRGGCTQGVHGNVLRWDGHQRKSSCAKYNGSALLLYVNNKNLKLRKLTSSINQVADDLTTIGGVKISLVFL